MENNTPKKALKKKRSKNISRTTVSDDDSDNEIQDYNGIETTLDDDNNDWSSDEDRELVEKVKATSKDTDKVSYKTRLKQLNWNEIAFKSYSADDCEKRFQGHLKHVRRHRNLSEISEDIAANIKKCKLKKPLNSYQLFVQDRLTNVQSSGDFSETMRNLALLYKGLPLEEKLSYDRRAEQLRQEHKRKKEELQSGHVAKVTTTPSTNKAKTPFNLFVESKQSEKLDYATLRVAYANLSRDEKYRFVIRAVSDAQEHSEKEDVSTFLTKDEQRILKCQVKSTPSAYALFVKEMYSKIKDAFTDQGITKNVFTEAASRWKTLDAKKKQIYTNAAALLREKSLQDQDEFNKRHGVTPKKMKRRKSTYVEQVPEISDDDEEEERVTSPKSKKRKLSVSSHAESGSDETYTKQIQLKSPTKHNSSKLNAVSSAQSLIEAKQSPVKVTQSPVKTFQSPAKVPQSPVVEKKRRKFDWESSDHETANEKSESDAALSSGSTNSKKKSKKEKKSKIVEPPGEKPPSNLLKYFAAHIHTGKPHKMQKAFDKLSKKERKDLNAEYNEKVETYMTQLKKYLNSLSKEDAVAYIEKVKTSQDAENNEDGNDSSQEY